MTAMVRTAPWPSDSDLGRGQGIAVTQPQGSFDYIVVVRVATCMCLSMWAVWLAVRARAQAHVSHFVDLVPMSWLKLLLRATPPGTLQ